MPDEIIKVNVTSITKEGNIDLGDLIVFNAVWSKLLEKSYAGERWATIAVNEVKAG